MAERTEVNVCWESTVYPDGGMYEGLMKDGQCHGKGVFQYADGDRFEGEYQEGLMDGLGVYKWSNGSVFFGQWKENNMHGCGKKYYPGGAIEEGEWVDDDFVGDFTACNAQEAETAKVAAVGVAASARMFMYKPDGEVTLKNGLRLEQHPVVYTAGTEFLMPGDAGDKYPVPEWAEIPIIKANSVMVSIFKNWNFKIPSQAELEDVRPEIVGLLESWCLWQWYEFPMAKDQALDKKRQAELQRIQAEQAKLAGDNEDDDEDDEDDEDDDEDEDGSAPKGTASISMSMMRSNKVHKSFENAARRVVRNFIQRRAQRQQQQSERAPPMACLSLAFRM